MVKKTPANKDRQGKTVLVVDDEGPIRRLVCRLCENIGVTTVLDAANIRDALELLEKNHVDLVISDLNVPDESGLKILHALRAARKETAVLIFSGSADASEQKKVGEAGVDYMICKGSDLSELESAVRKTLGL